MNEIYFHLSSSGATQNLIPLIMYSNTQNYILQLFQCKLFKSLQWFLVGKVPFPAFQAFLGQIMLTLLYSFQVSLSQESLPWSLIIWAKMYSVSKAYCVAFIVCLNSDVLSTLSPSTVPQDQEQDPHLSVVLRFILTQCLICSEH